MAKQLNIKLNIDANTKAAEQALQNLQVNLNKIATMQSPGLGSQLSKDLSIAKQSAQDLQQHLINAFNVKTGNLDLNRLDASLKSAGQSLGGLSTNLLKAGQTGQQAFLNIQQSIAHASVQINQANGLLTQFWTTLKNTARWQISSSILHGFVGSLQSAWSYAKDLDESLNNIRIVTGYNVEQMSKFAEQANKAAKALSTTTTDYTNASLIYYQQGLSDTDVKARTDVTIKMANASRQSAEIVSDQLTAIWNNFDDGTKSLEYYADVITALGAATASSSEEISDGLEKFAAVAETVGLSYEYATAALATVTATTRQSADVVGTAFKTLFARLNDLKLGETLDDGTTLGQYTENLAKVGVNIKDASGNLKDMDVILNETAAKWETLDKAQQVALAKGVAGIRQYTQFIALMDNWDFMQENLKTVESSSGTLQKQADIYAESWEAATDRVKAAAQGIYRDLLPTEELTGMADGFAVFLEGIDGLVRGLGGLEGILLAISTIVLNVFQRQLGSALDAGIAKVATFGTTLTSKFNNIPSVWQQFITGASTSAAKTNQLVNSTQHIAANIANGKEQLALTEGHLKTGVSLATQYSMEMAQSSYSASSMMSGMKTYATNLLAVNNVQAMIEQSSKYLTTEQKTQLALLQEQTLEANEQLLAANDRYKMIKLENDALLQRKGDNAGNVERYDAIEVNGNDRMEYTSTVMNTGTMKKDVAETLMLYKQQHAELAQGNVVLSKRGSLLTFQMDRGDEIVAINKQANSEYAKIYQANIKISQIAKDTTKTEKQKKADIQKVVDALSKESKVSGEILTRSKAMEGSSEQIAKKIQAATDKQRQFAEATGSSDAHLNNIESGQIKSLLAQENQVVSQENFNNKLQQTSNLLQNGLKSAMSWGNVLAKAAGGISSVAMGISAVSNAFETFSDEDASFTSKLTAGAMAATMGINALMTVLSGLQAIIQGLNVIQTLNNITQAVTNTLKEKELDLTTEKGMAEAANLIIQKLGIAEDQKEAATQFILNSLKEKGIAATIKDTAARWGNVASQAAQYWYISLIIAGLAIVIGLVYAMIKAYQNSTPEAKLKAAKEEAEALNGALDEAKKAAEDLQAAFDSYDSAVKKLEECTEGTKEWRDALRNVNTEVLNLLSKYPELSTMVNDKGEKAIDYGAHGELVVADWAQEQLMDEANQAVINTQVAATAANAKVREAQIAVDRKDLGTKLNKVSGTTAYMHTSDGSFDVSSMISSYIANNAEEFATLKTEDKKAKLQSYVSSQYNVTADVDSWVSAIEELGPEFGNLINSIEANTAATELENEIMAQTVLADNENVQNSGLAAEITKITSQDLDKQIEAEKAAMDRWGKDGIWKSTGVNQEARDVFAEYAKAAGITNYDLLDTTGNDENRKFVYNANGQETTVSLETMKSVVAASRANAKLAENADQLVATLANKTDAEVAAITAASSKDTQFLTVDQVTGDYDIESLAKSLGEADLKAMGYEGSLEEMQAAYMADYKEVAENGKLALKDTIDDYVSTIATELTALKDSGLLKGLTLAEVDALGAMMESALISSGQEGVALISDIFKQAQAEGFGDEVVDVFQGVDWSTAVPETLKTALKEAGVTTQFTSEQLQQLIDMMDTAANSIDGATNKYKTLNDIIKDINTGDTISAEEFAALGDGFDEYFMRMADGTYKLIADAETFYNIVHQKSLEGFEKVISTTTTENDKITSLLSNFNFEKGELENADKAEVVTGRVRASKDKTFRMLKEDGVADVRWNPKNVQAQLDLLSVSGSQDAAKIANWQTKLDNNMLDQDTLNQISSAVTEWTKSVGGAEQAQEQLNDKLADNKLILKEAYEAMASSATSFKELNQMLDEGKIDIDAYSKAWRGLNEEKYSDLDAEAVNDYATYLAEEMDIAEDEAKNVAKAVMNMNKGVESLNSNWEEWGGILKSSLKTGKEQTKWSQEYQEALRGTRSALADILNVSEEFISTDFMESNLQDIEKAANGDAAAIDRLMKAASKDIIVNMELEDGVEAQALDLHDKLMKDLPNLSIGMTIDDADFITNAQELLNTSKMTVDEAQAYFNSLGYNPEFEEVEIDEPLEGTRTITENIKVEQYPLNDGRTFDYIESADTYTEPYKTGKTHKVRVPVLNDDGTPKIKKLHKINTGSMNNRSSTNPGGNNTNNKSKPSRPKRNDYLKRYKEQDDALDDIADAMERVNKQADRLYGKDRIDALKKQNELLLKQRDILKDKQSAAKIDLELDKADLDLVAKKHGIEFKYDEATGNIINYTQALSSLKNQLLQYKTEAYEKGDPDYKKDKIEELETKLQEIQDAIDLYEETRELIEDNEKAIEDAFHEWQDNNYEQIQYKLEVQLEVEDAELRMLDYYFNKLSDDVFSMAEAAEKLVSKLDPMKNSLSHYENFYNTITKAYGDGNGEISQEKFVEGLNESFDGILNNLEALQDLDEQMMHYYEDTLAAGSEALALYTDQMEHLTSVLDHYHNIVTMLNGEYDFASIGTILEAKAHNTKAELDTATQYYGVLKSEQQRIQSLYDSAMARGDSAAAALHFEELKAITAEVDETYETILSKTEELVEAHKAIMENAVKEARHAAEMQLSNGWGFDQLNSSMDRLSSYSEEYLTKTNQIYETQKLMNTAQQAIDKTTNQAAKVRLENYNKEIKALQDKNKLSNLELELAQARYDVLVAEIALEEAQKAKATVRLQKDSDGNYGYVYTANQESISKAEQDLADAQNALYNISLDGANDYGQKRIELQQQVLEELAALTDAYHNGEFASEEEFQAARDRILAEYAQLSEAYSEQYTLAIQADSKTQEEAWITAYDEMMLTTDEWKSVVVDCNTQCEEAYSHYRAIVEAESAIVKELMSNVSGAVSDVTTKTDELKTAASQLVTQLGAEYLAVGLVTAAYANQRGMIQGLITDYEQLAEEIKGVLQEQAGLISSDDNFDTSIDYAAVMYESYKKGDYYGFVEAAKNRDKKIELTGGNDYGVSTERLMKYIKDGGLPNEAGYFTDELLKAYKDGFSTGGYTGEWGPEGKLAWLHEKELILNARDTENFLAATGILRDISKAIDLSSIQSQSAWLQAIGMTKSEQQTLEQMVSIEAHFPNVTDRNEIEEAFNNLINTASQYANRKF